ncbi:MAG TPA: formate dehydrogenase subunit gamma [Thermoanaerobaculia bacterium]|nr:formate dehydrogenase subunit gamma [Thermoanaerobaculia bacterium]
MNDESHLLPNGRVLRYTFRERLMHWVSGISYVYLMLTGLAFWSPWLFWIAVVLGGATISRMLHPWVGLIFTAAVLWMDGTWGRQMRTTERDRQWLRSVKHYVRNEDDQVPDEDRFNAGQKLLFWGFLWCGIVLFLTGIVLWVPNWIPWSLRFLRLAAVILHPIAALLTIGLFMIHLYMGLAIEPGAFGSIVRGDVTRRWAARFHRVWYDRIAGNSTAKE